MEKQLDALLKHCHEFAVEALTETQEFYPIAAYITEDDTVYPVDLQIDKKAVPDNGEVIDLLTERCDILYNMDKVTGHAMAFEVEVQLNETTAVSAIAIHVKHKKLDAPAFYYPFKIGNNQHIEFGESFAVKQ